ncbi:DUF3459 domain-containing protein [Humibacter sp. BT305]|nr:DUF3459 domain-containing protein [Humibacter sp. BT305]
MTDTAATGDWWRYGVLYQVYVPSFQDGDGDGFGDLWGVEERLDYIAELGVTAIWLSPVYASPLEDFGYDVSGYTEIGSVFGDLDVFDRVIEGAHRRGLRVLMDYVQQHTSSQHPWFLDALTSRTAEHREWYLWEDPAADGGPPNNWASAFAGPAWTLHEPTGQYYDHAHLPEQPSLNWRNPAVKQAMFDVLRFWLDRGVDGFRVDAVWRLIKDAQLRDNPTPTDDDPTEIAGAAAHSTVRQVQKYTADQPELPGLLSEMRSVVSEYPDRLLMGELHLKLERVAALGSLPGLDIPMNFALIDTPWNGDDVAQLITRYEAALTARSWRNWVLSNHDRSRLATRVGLESTRAALALLLTLRGTPTLYYGDELGLPDSPVPADRERDCAALRAAGQGLGRDPQRMPMPWTTAPHTGFTADDVEPWLPIPDWAGAYSVSAQDDDPHSVLRGVKELLALRQAHSALRRGTSRIHHHGPDELVLLRELDDDAIAVVINFSDGSLLPSLPKGEWEQIWSTGPSAGGALEARGARLYRRSAVLSSAPWR